MAIGFNILGDHFASIPIPIEQWLHFGLAAGGLLQCRYGFANTRPRCGAGWRVLLAQEFLRFRGPGHEFAIETEPIGREIFPKTSLANGKSNTLEKFTFKSRVREEAASSTRGANAKFIFHDTEAPQRCVPVTTDDDDGARSHVLLLANNLLDTFFAKVGKSFGRVF